MSKVYLLDAGMSARPLLRMKCANEDQELQQLLIQNPELLPSEQICPENPPEWLLVKREMPVPDPATGSERWSLDFLYVDHLGIPTLVECKRSADTRSRREVIAQMLEYAANGHHYWTGSVLLENAARSQGGMESLERWVAEHSAIPRTAGEFFEVVALNLRESKMRLIFFLEESSNELRSLVDFLNSQLKFTEVLLVEVRLYDSPSGRLAVPWLFGFTEEARVAKREAYISATRNNTETGEEAFFAAVDSNAISNEFKISIRHFIQEWQLTTGDDPGWTFRVNAIFLVPRLLRSRGLFHVGRNGDIQLYFGYWNTMKNADVGPEQDQLKNCFAEEIQKLFGVEFTDKQMVGFPTIKTAQWIPKLDLLIEIVKRAVG